MPRSKYNVDRNKKDRTYNDIVFDSVVEMRFYRDFVCPKMKSGEIKRCELQKRYELQPAYTYKSEKMRAIYYDADFYIEYKDGKNVVIDIKGFPDSVAKLKKKLFHFKYPDIDYQWIKYVKKYGGWIKYEDYNKLKKEERKAKKIKEKSNE